MDKNSKGFVHLVLIIGIVLVGIVGIGYFVLKGGQVRTSSQQGFATPTPFAPDIYMSNWKTYRSEEFGIEFKYPEGWEVSESSLEIQISEPDNLLGFMITAVQSNTSMEDLVSDRREIARQLPAQTLYTQSDAQIGNYQTLEVRDQYENHTQSDIFVVLEDKQLLVNSTFLYSNNARRNTIKQILSTLIFIE